MLSAPALPPLLCALHTVWARLPEPHGGSNGGGEGKQSELAPQLRQLVESSANLRLEPSASNTSIAPSPLPTRSGPRVGAAWRAGRPTFTREVCPAPPPGLDPCPTQAASEAGANLPN